MALQRQVIRPGDMRNIPKKNDMIRIHYSGWIYEPTERTKHYRGRRFDSTIARGQPLEFALGQGLTVGGLEAALPQMSLGEKCVWIVSSDLGYGKTGLPGVIPPDTTLIFEVELLAINGKSS